MHKHNGSAGRQEVPESATKLYSFREIVGGSAGNFFNGDSKPMNDMNISCKACARKLLISLVAGKVIPSNQGRRIREEIQSTSLKENCGKGIPLLLVIGTHNHMAGS